MTTANFKPSARSSSAVFTATEVLPTEGGPATVITRMCGPPRRGDPRLSRKIAARRLDVARGERWRRKSQPSHSGARLAAARRPSGASEG